MSENTEPAIDVAGDAVAESPVISGPLPGVSLRAAREAMSMTVNDVAQVLRFSPRQIEALERDDYASLPGATAVRGFIRSYAKLVKIDAVPLLATLDPAVPVPAADVRPPSNMGEAAHPTISERASPRVVVIGLVAFVVALLAFWFLTLPPGTPQKSSAPEVSGTITQPAVQPIVQPNATDPAGAAVTPPVPAVLATGDAAVSVAAPIAAAPSGLRVEFDDRSWIEIRDAAQKIVFVGEFPAGTRQNVEGKAPFQIWIGRASAVRVFMGDRSIDLKPHTREDVARLSVE